MRGINGIGLWVVLALHCSAKVLFSVSGFSSGGFMAVQTHVAYSESVFAAGVAAGGPYYCAMGSNVRLQSACTDNPYLIDLTTLTSYANISSQEGLIDNISNLSNSKVFIFSAKQDRIVRPGVVSKTLQFYQTYVTTGEIMQVFGNEGAHNWPTEDYGNPCWADTPPGIGSCGYDTAGEMLQFIYGNLSSKVSFNNSNLFSFNQALYVNNHNAGFSSRGWVYANDACRKKPILCRLHVHFHGCGQNYDRLGKIYVSETGFGEWAESNNLVILFPQTVGGVPNNSGCWDFTGLYGADYVLKSGPQTSAIQRMAQSYTDIVQSNIEMA